MGAVITTPAAVFEQIQVGRFFRCGVPWRRARTGSHAWQRRQQLPVQHPAQRLAQGLATAGSERQFCDPILGRSGRPADPGAGLAGRSSRRCGPCALAACSTQNRRPATKSKSTGTASTHSGSTRSLTSYTRWKLTLSTTIRSPAAKSASSAVLDGFQSYQGLRFGPSYSKSPTRSPPSVRMRARVRSVSSRLPSWFHQPLKSGMVRQRW